MLEARQARPDRRHFGAAVDVMVTVAVAAHRQQHARLDLREPVGHTARAELGRARRPDRAEAGGGDERDQRLGDVRQVGDDAVAGADAEPLQAGAHARDLLAQITERQLDRRPRLRAREHGDSVAVVVGPDQVLGVVQPRACKPATHQASFAPPGRARTAPGTGSRRTPRSSSRSPRGRRPTSATVRRRS